MKRMLCVLAIGVATIGCGKKAETKASEAVAPGPAKLHADTPPSDSDRNLLAGAAAVTTSELEFNAPTGDKIPLKLVTRLDGATWVADVMVGGKLEETIDTTVPKDSPTLQPKASLVRMANVVVFLTGATRSDGADRYDARIYGWSDATKQLALAKQIRFTGKLAAPIAPEKP